MAKVLTISKSDSVDSIKKKIIQWNQQLEFVAKSFDAAKFTGKIKSYGNGLDYQRRLRNEWD
jgi:hypothetical protein